MELARVPEDLALYHESEPYSERLKTRDKVQVYQSNGVNGMILFLTLSCHLIVILPILVISIPPLAFPVIPRVFIAWLF